MESDTSSDEEDLTAFDVLMQPTSKKAKVVDPIYIAVIYIRWPKWIDPSEPLYMAPYVGQAVRAGTTAEEVVVARWKEENYQAIHTNKRVGLPRELKVHGPVAFENQIVEWKRGPRSEVQKWANEREPALVSKYGGPLRDPSVRCNQTLNLTKGGKGHCSFEGIDALRTVAWLTFQDEMEEYVECYGTSLVPSVYVNPVSGYKLGSRLAGVRRGELWKGHPDESNRVKWLESLPGWAWNAQEAPEFVAACSERVKRWRKNATQEELAEWSRKQSEAKSTPEYVASASERGRAQAVREAAEGKTSLVERGKEWRENATEEELAEWSRKISETMSAPEFVAASSERSKAQAVREAAEGKTSLAERGKETRFDHMSTAQYEAFLQKTTVKKDQTRMRKRASMTEEHLLVDIASKAKDKRMDDRKKARLLAYRSVFGRPNAKVKEVVDAVRRGVFFQDANGVWCARMQDQGGSQGAGSSSDDAKRTEVEMDLEEETDEAKAVGGALEQQEEPEAAEVEAA